MDRGKIVLEDTKDTVKNAKKIPGVGFIIFSIVSVLFVYVIYSGEIAEGWIGLEWLIGPGAMKIIAIVTCVSTFYISLALLRQYLTMTNLKICTNGVQLPFVTFDRWLRRKTFVFFKDIVDIKMVDVVKEMRGKHIEPDYTKWKTWGRKKPTPEEWREMYMNLTNQCRIITKDGMKHKINGDVVSNTQKIKEKIEEYLQLYREGKLS